MKLFDELVGRTIISAHNNDDVLTLTLEDGTVCELYHERDFCANVAINNINGDFADLVGKPLTVAKEEDVTDELGAPYEYAESYTWTRYTLATADHSVSITWLGESNGYHSEDVYFRVVPASK